MLYFNKSALGGDIMFSEQISYGNIKIRNYWCDICDKEIELEASSNKKFNDQLAELGWFRKKVSDKDWHFCSQDCFNDV